MPRALCPRQCGRLTASAIFISAGIVQLIAGLLLLKSDYVDILAAPNFWTSVSNISVGCLIGLSASVWKHNRRNRSINRTRRHLVIALFISSLAVNSATSVILVLGEGNTLLSIKMVQVSIGEMQATFASEVLAYAYAASVIAPIVCVVLSLITLLVTCCPDSSSPSRFTRRQFRKRLENSDTYSWVYTPEADRSTKPLERDNTSSKSPSNFSTRSNITLSSSFSGFASGLDSPYSALKTMDKRPQDRTGDDRDVTLDSISPNRTDSSFEEIDSPTAVSEIVPISLGIKTLKRTNSGVPVRSPIAPEGHYRSWRRDLEDHDHTPESDASRRPKTKMSLLFETNEKEIKPQLDDGQTLEVDDYEKSRRLIRKEYRKVDCRRVHSKKPDFRRLKLMESINECSGNEWNSNNHDERFSPSTSSGYGSSLDRKARRSLPEHTQDSSEFGDDSIHSTQTNKDIGDLTIQERLDAYVEG